MRHISLLLTLGAAVSATHPDEEFHHTQLLQTKVQRPSENIAVKMIKKIKEGGPRRGGGGGRKDGGRKDGGGGGGGGRGGGGGGDREPPPPPPPPSSDTGTGAEPDHAAMEADMERCGMQCIFPDGMPASSTGWAAEPVCEDGPSCVMNEGFLNCFTGCLGNCPVVEGINACKEQYGADGGEKVIQCLECGHACLEESGCAPAECGQSAAFLGCHESCMSDAPDMDYGGEESFNESMYNESDFEGSFNESMYGPSSPSYGDDSYPGPSYGSYPVLVENFVAKMIKQVNKGPGGGGGDGPGGGGGHGGGGGGGRGGGPAGGGSSDTGTGAEPDHGGMEDDMERCGMQCVFPDGMPAASTGWAAEPVCEDGPSCVMNEGFLTCFTGCLGECPVVEGINACKAQYGANGGEKVIQCLECGHACQMQSGCAPADCGDDAGFLGCHESCMEDPPEGGPPEMQDEGASGAAASSSSSSSSSSDSTDLMQVKQHLK